MIRPPPSSTLFPYPPLFRSRGAALERPPAARAQRDAEQPLSGRRSPCRQQRALDEDPREDDEEAEQVAVDGLDHNRRDQSERSEEHSLNSSHDQISYAVFCL